MHTGGALFSTSAGDWAWSALYTHMSFLVGLYELSIAGWRVLCFLALHRRCLKMNHGIALI
jgi:hypothetical protein